MPITVDVSTLSGWDDLASGTYSITIKAKKTNNINSNASTGVSVIKAPSSYNVTVSGETNSGGSIYIYDGTNNTGELLFARTDTAGNYSTTVVCETGHLYVTGSRISCFDYTGGVSLLEESQSGAILAVSADGTFSCWSTPCFVAGTMITLSDGSAKKVEDITFDDKLLVYDFYNGKLNCACPKWIMEEKVTNKYLRILFDNGSELKVAGPGGDVGYHSIFNYDSQKFAHTGIDATPIGTNVFTQSGHRAKIVSQEVINEEVKYYNIITDKHYNLFANGILTSCRLSNRYGIENMKYNLNDVRMTDKEVQSYIDGLTHKGFKIKE